MFPPPWIEGSPPTASATSATPWRWSSPGPWLLAEDAAERLRVDASPALRTSTRPRPASGAGGLGRVRRQCLEPLRVRRQGDDRRGLREGAPRGAPPLRHHPRPRAVHGAARGAGRLGPGRGALHAPRRRAVSPSRADRARQQYLQGPRAQHPRDRGRRRAAASAPRAGNTPSTASCSGPRKQDPPARQVGVRAPRGHPRRRARARQRHRGRAGPGHPRRPLPRPPGAHPGQRGRLRVVRSQPARHVLERRDARRASTPCPPLTCTSPERPQQHERHRPLPGRGPARGHVRHRAPDRRRRPASWASTPSSCGAGTSSQPSAMPYKTPLGTTYDCGEFGRNMEAAVKLADVAGFPARREASGARGVLRGLAVVDAIERAAGPGARLRRGPLQPRAAPR